MKLRLDKLMVDRALVPSRERAQALILAGRVLVEEQKVDKPGAQTDSEAAIRLLGEDIRYVSRGGLKLEAALKHWQIDLTGRAVADIGASTGGFSDCMLQHDAAAVIAVDTGYGQIAQKLRADARVKLRERTNARLLTAGELYAESPNVSFLAIDVAFISVTLILGPVVGALAAAGNRWQGEAVILVKPQFEAGREHIGKGGIVRDPAAHQLAIDRVREAALALGAKDLDLIDSPIHGMEGNKEFLLHARFA